MGSFTQNSEEHLAEAGKAGRLLRSKAGGRAVTTSHQAHEQVLKPKFRERRMNQTPQSIGPYRVRRAALIPDGIPVSVPVFCKRIKSHKQRGKQNVSSTTLPSSKLGRS